jgi:hypothetical protein
MPTRQAPSLVLGPDDNGRILTDEEFAEAEFQEPWRFERVAGRLVVMSPEGKSTSTAPSPGWTNSSTPGAAILISCTASFQTPGFVSRTEPTALGTSASISSRSGRNPQSLSAHPIWFSRSSARAPCRSVETMKRNGRTTIARGFESTSSSMAGRRQLRS